MLLGRLEFNIFALTSCSVSKLLFQFHLLISPSTWTVCNWLFVVWKFILTTYISMLLFMQFPPSPLKLFMEWSLSCHFISLSKIHIIIKLLDYTTPPPSPSSELKSWNVSTVATSHVAIEHLKSGKSQLRWARSVK